MEEILALIFVAHSSHHSSPHKIKKSTLNAKRGRKYPCSWGMPMLPLRCSQKMIVEEMIVEEMVAEKMAETQGYDDIKPEFVWLEYFNYVGRHPTY
ncbi:hypothetical protein [Yersinia pseudotuberculosis]|uniref:hypothetical protein n=2 Tax=Yersinia pseudotuberculosis TaxID=633 RepID=UPI0011B1F27A|nr:hypothetical protein [Yersinia pseudotuberculosis]